MFTAVLTLSSNVVVVGGLDNKPIKTVETGQLLKEELQWDVEDVAKQRDTKLFCRSLMYLTHLISCTCIKFNKI